MTDQYIQVIFKFRRYNYYNIANFVYYGKPLLLQITWRATEVTPM